ncbi:hypothetical protein Zmor_025059 [Zophobas morio]|uniref:Uncharacterized protein n=1 Tax=Zophobas morio TaxID=2755281 RepID=A0AA38HT50_9CUCU|nr:hypothetical protein Zmor_025059 [Zophobas morio]
MSYRVEWTAFLRERYEREELHFKVFDNYIPDYKKTLLTTKFYSKYENQNTGCEADPTVMQNIQRVKYDTPREKYAWPITENQCYGWFPEPLVSLDRNDTRFHHPKKSTDFVKHELRLQMDESTFPKVKFTGIPFKVQ